MQIKIITGFDFAHRGVEIKTYAPGDVVDATDPQLAEIALAQGWAVAVAADAEPDGAMRAPEDKDAARQRRLRKG